MNTEIHPLKYVNCLKHNIMTIIERTTTKTRQVDRVSVGPATLVIAIWRVVVLINLTILLSVITFFQLGGGGGEDFKSQCTRWLSEARHVLHQKLLIIKLGSKWPLLTVAQAKHELICSQSSSFCTPKAFYLGLLLWYAEEESTINRWKRFNSSKNLLSLLFVCVYVCVCVCVEFTVNALLSTERCDLWACHGKHCRRKQSKSTYSAPLKWLLSCWLICVTPMERLAKGLMRHKMMINEFIGSPLIKRL